WDELTKIMDWSIKNVTSVFHICWGAQAVLYHLYGIGKRELDEKCFGIFEHTMKDPTVKLVRGFGDILLEPHSRHTEVIEDEVADHPYLDVLASSSDAGVCLMKSRDANDNMLTENLKYDAITIKDEYHRDVAKGVDIQLPNNYFPNDYLAKISPNPWRTHTH